MTFLRFLRIDGATKTATVDAAGVVVRGHVPIFAMGRAGNVGHAHVAGDAIKLRIDDPNVFRLVAEGALTGVEMTTNALAKGGRDLIALILRDRPEFEAAKGTANMFAKSYTAPRESYRIADVWRQEPRPRPAPLSFGELGKLTKLQKAATPQAASDAARLYDPTVSPSLRAGVIHAAMLAANGVVDPNAETLRDQIAALVDSGAITMPVAGALLRAMDPEQSSDSANFEGGSPSLSDRSDGASRLPNGYYPATGPAGGGAKGAVALAQLRRMFT